MINLYPTPAALQLTTWARFHAGDLQLLDPEPEPAARWRTVATASGLLTLFDSPAGQEMLHSRWLHYAQGPSRRFLSRRELSFWAWANAFQTMAPERKLFPALGSIVKPLSTMPPMLRHIASVGEVGEIDALAYLVLTPTGTHPQVCLLSEAHLAFLPIQDLHRLQTAVSL